MVLLRWPMIWGGVGLLTAAWGRSVVSCVVLSSSWVITAGVVDKAGGLLYGFVIDIKYIHFPINHH